MIIKCPKCKTKFEVADNLLSNGEMKFQCSECAYIWSERIEKAAGGVKLLQKEEVVMEEKLPSILVEDEAENLEKKNNWKVWLSAKNLVIACMALALVGIVLLVGRLVVSSGKSSGGKSIFEDARKNAAKAKDLYIEIIKPLTLTKEGNNEYIIIRGFVYNPTNVRMNVPKLVIRLENRDERVLQEQEREIEKKSLAPLEKTDFMFKVFKFSSQVVRVKVDFADETKI